MNNTHATRRTLVKLAGMSMAGAVGGMGNAAEHSPAAVALFDGRTLDGWLQLENSATSLSTAGIVDAPAFAAKLTQGTDAVSEFLRSRLQPAVTADLAASSGSTYS